MKNSQVLFRQQTEERGLASKASVLEEWWPACDHGPQGRFVWPVVLVEKL